MRHDEEAFAPEHSSWIDSIDLVDSVLVSTGSRCDDTGDGGWTIIVRRHDLSTGAEVWQRTLAQQQPLVSMGAIAIAGDQLLVAGTSGTTRVQGRFLAAYNLSGTLLWAQEDKPTSVTAWNDVRQIGGEDFILTGLAKGDGNDYRLVLRRIGPNGEERWTNESELGTALSGSSVAVGPGDEIAVAANTLTGNHWQAHTLRFASDGSLRWTSEDEGSTSLGAQAWNAAIGAGSIAVTGVEDTMDVWVDEARVRVFAFE